MVTLLEERRLIMRVYGVWQKFAASGFPRRTDIDPACFGPDSSNCLVIDLHAVPSLSRFSHVGWMLREQSGAPFDGNCISECRPGSLLELVARQVSRIALKQTAIGFGGSAIHDETDILYRAVLLPLSNDGKRIDGLLGAVGFRPIVVAEDAPLSDIAWCNRLISERLSDILPAPSKTKAIPSG